MLVPERLVSGACYTTLVIFPWCNWVLYVSSHCGSAAKATDMGRNSAMSKRKPPDNLSQGSSQYIIPGLQSHERLFWPGCTWKMKRFTNASFSIHNKPHTDQLYHYFNIILPGRLRFQGLKKNYGVTVIMCLWEKVRLNQEESSVVPLISVCSCYCDSQTTVTLQTSPPCMYTLSSFWGQYW